jgi:hypothetical protein
LALVVLAQACGSDDGKKRALSDGDAGMGGQAGSPEPNIGGSSAGAPGGMGGELVVEGGMGGVAEEPVAGGMGGMVEVVAGAGAGGVPSPAEPELLFSVKGQGGTPGLPGTAVNGEAHPQNSIYTSNTGSQDRVQGTNAVKVTGVSMGLDPTDAIAAFALVQPEPENPLFLFTVADGSEGAYQSRVNRSYNEDGGDEQANLYYSEGTQSSRYLYLGEGGDEYGYNALLATEASLGLVGGELDGPYPDDLTGLAVHDARLPLGDLYFTVSPNAAGAPDTAVATTAADQRACTVFKTAQDGTNSVAFSCAQLGLVPGDVIDGLAVWGEGTPTQVVFSVSVNSVGAADTALFSESTAENPVGATLFTSAGDGANAVLKSERDLGLGEHYYGDEIDGFTVVPAPAKANVAHAATCQMTYDPLAAAQGGLSSIAGTLHIGTNIVVLSGPAINDGSRLLAYNATNCTFLQSVDLPSGFESTAQLAIVPLAGWSKSTPLDNVEYLRVTDDGQASQLAIRRYDATGEFVELFAIPGTSYVDTATALIHEPINDRLYLLLAGPYQYADRLAVFARPVATDTITAPTFHSLATPCANQPNINGTDAAGNLYLAQQQLSRTDYEVCAFRPDGELLPLPYGWASDTSTAGVRGFIAPGASHFVVRTDRTPVEIERGAYQSP